MANFSQIDEARKAFGLPDSATLEEIKKAYRQLARQYHPDTCAEKDKEQCERMFKKMTQARDLLINYCAAYRFSFKKEDVEAVRMDQDFLYDHLQQFYDDWMSR
ncbi:DnaJ domain-containing protein [bacterium]|nr:DnaJ domain-containing protein [bacterium]